MQLALTRADVDRPRPRGFVVVASRAGGCGRRSHRTVGARRAYAAGSERVPCIDAVVPLRARLATLLQARGRGGISCEYNIENYGEIVVERTCSATSTAC